MLTLLGNQQKFCDGVSRRNFLKVGALAVGGFTLADLLKLEAQAGGSVKRKSIINIYLGGGPTHMDTFDLKPKAPAEYRGEFRPIETNVPGMEICELLPNLARLADKFSIVRSIMDLNNEHNSTQSDSGWSVRSLQNMNGRPGIGAVVSKLHGTVTGNAPTSVALSSFGSHGFLSPVYQPFRPDSAGRANLQLNRSLNSERLTNRNELLGKLDRMRREVDQSRMMESMDQFTKTAIQVVTSGELSDALDTNKEDPRLIERYGLKQNGRYAGNRSFLLARRLVEAGVRVVGLNWGGWDSHQNNFKTMRDQLPALDVGLSALIEDLDTRGLLDDTIIMMSGEFGRTPRINNGAGRDHWPAAGFWFLGGGGFQNGQVIGSTTANGERPQDRPVHLQQVYATVYRQLGIDPAATIFDNSGRPQYLLDYREPITELL